MAKMRWLLAVGTAAAVGALSAAAPPHAADDPNAPPAERPASNLDYWLTRATDANQDANDPNAAAGRPAPAEAAPRPDALPAVVRLSDGKVLPGWLHSTRERPWVVLPKGRKRWRRIPPAAVLSITAVVVEEKMELQWRWKEMGVPERVYTGKSYPRRRLLWRFRLIDGTKITGTVKGQPLWVLCGKKRHGPFVLHERVKGKIGEDLDDLLHVEKVVISRRLMRKLRDQRTEEAGGAGRPDPT
jgi:hypothetical protein